MEILVVLNLFLPFFFNYIIYEEQEKLQKLFDRGFSWWGVQIAYLHPEESILHWDFLILFWRAESHFSPVHVKHPVLEFAFTTQLTPFWLHSHTPSVLIGQVNKADLPVSNLRRSFEAGVGMQSRAMEDKRGTCINSLANYGALFVLDALGILAGWSSRCPTCQTCVYTYRWRS